jgi:hypothetical protein
VLSYDVGVGLLRPGADVPEVLGAAGHAERLGDIGGADVSDRPALLDSLGVEASNGPTDKGSQWPLLIRQRLDIGDASDVINITWTLS